MSLHTSNFKSHNKVDDIYYKIIYHHKCTYIHHNKFDVKYQNINAPFSNGRFITTLANRKTLNNN